MPEAGRHVAHVPTRRGLRTLAGTALLGLLAATTAPASAAGGTTQRVSVSSLGVQGSALSGNGDRNQVVSSDGRVVAFYSEAPELTRGDRNGVADVVVRELAGGRTTRASTASSGAQADGASGWPSLDATGRRVAFLSFAGNLVPGDTNASPDVFVRDRQAGTTTRVSVTGSGRQSAGWSGRPAISGDGRRVAFESDAADLLPPGSPATGLTQVFVHDLVTGETTLVSGSSRGTPGNRSSGRPSLSADGRRVAFQSEASNLVPGDTNAHCTRQGGCASDVFVRDTAAGTTVRASVRTDGAQALHATAPSISGDGQRVAMLGQSLSADDTTAADDVYVRDLPAGTTTLVSRSTGGAQAQDGSTSAELSRDGRTVAFSTAAALVPRDTNGREDVYARDLLTGSTRRVSVAASGAQGDEFSSDPDVSADGRVVVFLSYAHQLVPDDTNGVLDVFVRSP